jgi:phospholipid/cholesterol/gamma-HCH transport system substrate-binding protein
VLGAAGLFLAYALGVGGVGGTSGGYEVTARFGQVGGLAPGADVRLAGVKVGTVADVTLDPKTFMAVTRLSLRDDVLVPADSTAKVTSDGLLGGSHLAIAPADRRRHCSPAGRSRTRRAPWTCSASSAKSCGQPRAAPAGASGVGRTPIRENDRASPCRNPGAERRRALRGRAGVCAAAAA